jgi:hypothetical protein
MDSSKVLRGFTRRSNRDSQLRCRGRRPGLVPGLPLPTTALQSLAASRRRSGLRVGGWEPGNLETWKPAPAGERRRGARTPGIPGSQDSSVPASQCPARAMETPRDSNPFTSRHNSPPGDGVDEDSLASCRHIQLHHVENSVACSICLVASSCRPT